MIGVFDSGFGGLTILKGILNELPEYDFIYLGDNARVPYGTRSQEIIFDFSKQAVDYLFNQGCEIIIFACNTASAQALRKIQREYLPARYPDKNVLGVIRPTAEVAAKTTKNQRLGIIGTESTITSDSFRIELKHQNKNIVVFQKAAPLLVPIVEAGEANWRGTDLILKKYLEPLLVKKIDTLILGCTHYPLLKNKIRKITGQNIKVLSQDEIIGKKLKKYLKEHPEYMNKLSKGGKQKFLTTDYSPRFEKMAQRFFKQEITVKKIKLN